MSDRRGQHSAGGNSGYLLSDGNTFSQNPNINADEAGSAANLGLVVGSPSHVIGHVHHHSWTNTNLQRPQGISNPGVMFGIQLNTMQWPTVPAGHAFPDEAARQHMESTLYMGISNQAGGQHTASYPLLPPFPQSGLESGVWNFGMAPSSQYGPRDWSFEASTSYANGPSSHAWNFSHASPHNGLGSGAWNFQAPPSPSPRTNGHVTLLDDVLQSGPRFLGPNSDIPGTFISQYGHFFGGLGVAHTPVTFAAELESNHRALLEFQQSMYDDPQVVAMRSQFQQSSYDDPQVVAMPLQATQFNASQPPVIMGSLARHEDMIFEIHSMSYEINIFQPPIIMDISVHEDMIIDVDGMPDEGLSDFEEQLENENSGLTEETIMELLKKRKYECVACDLLSDAETCCICIDAFVHGEEIGALNCGHEFHTECIKNWLLIKNDCPMCKSKGLDV